MQQFLCSVLRWFEVEELLVLVDELGVHGGVKELVVGQNILEEWDVGLEMETQVERGKLRLCMTFHILHTSSLYAHYRTTQTGSSQQSLPTPIMKLNSSEYNNWSF